MATMLTREQRVDGQPAETLWAPMQDEHVDDPLEERKQRDRQQRYQRLGELPVADRDASGERGDEHRANRPRGRVFPELVARVGQREPLSGGARGPGGPRFSSLG